MTASLYFPNVSVPGDWDIGRYGVLVPRDANISGSFNGAALNGDHLAGFRNKLHNGGCTVVQRPSATITGAGSAVYGGADRLRTSVTATTVNVTVSALSPSNSRSRHAHLVSGTTTGATTLVVTQRLEARESMLFRNRTFMFSVELFQDTGAALSATLFLSKPGSTDNWAAPSTVATSTAINVPSGVWTTVAAPFTLGTTDADNGLAVNVMYQPAAFTSKNFYFSGFQFEPGSIKTPLEERPYALELALCQRYYEAFRGYYVAYGNSGTSFQRLWVPYKQRKRVVPTTLTAALVAGATLTSVGVVINNADGCTLGFGSPGAGSEGQWDLVADADL